MEKLQVGDKLVCLEDDNDTIDYPEKGYTYTVIEITKENDLGQCVWLVKEGNYWVEKIQSLIPSTKKRRIGLLIGFGSKKWAKI